MQTVKRNAKILVGGLLMTVIALAVSCSKSNSSNNTNTGSKPPPADATHIYLQDSGFKAYLQANICPDAFDKNGRLDITNAEVSGFNGTMVIDSTYKIVSLNGIAYFTKMSKLIVQNSLVDSVYLPTTMAIDTLRLLNDIDLQMVNVSGCTGMRYIRFNNIPATSLDLSNLAALNTISGLNSGRLSSLKVDNDANLQHLLCSGLTALPTVNTATCPNLLRLFLQYGYAVTSLDLTSNTKLKFLITTYAAGLKKVDFSHNPALTEVTLDQTGIDSIDFSHNPALFSVTMMFMTALKGINVTQNPNLRLLWLDGANFLKTIDLRTQTSFDYYMIDPKVANPNNALMDADVYEKWPDGFISPTQSAIYSLPVIAQRVSEGATMNLYAGLRLPQYLDVSALSLATIWINDAVKNNYSIVMARRVDGFVPQPVVTVYAADRTTVLCADYNEELETCN